MRIAIYARVSTTRQAETDLSIPDQVAQVENYAKRHGYMVINTYVEPGASATDDRRPVFQQMLTDALNEPHPFHAIIVHSYSRFFRDAVELELCVRRLRKKDIRLIAITQDFGDDPMAEMIRKIVGVFDEHSSKENGKHTKRAMKENARRGYHNGKPPFGFRHVGTGEVGNKGREKKRLDIEPSEAETVRRIYDLYNNGLDGHEIGMSTITQYLNDRGMLRRGRPWRIQTVDLALTNPIYRGEYIFNLRGGKDRKLNPEEEVIRHAVPGIVDEQTFRIAESRRRARRPSVTPARRLTSPHLLSGLLKCGCCGAGMVISTGTSRGGKVHGYYTCQTKLSRGSKACPSKRFPVTRLEYLVLTAFAENVLVPERLQAIMAELEKSHSQGSATEQTRIRELKARLNERDEAITNLMEAIERKVLPLDETTRQRVQLHQNARSEILLEIGRLRATQGPKINMKSGKHIKAFSQAVINRLFDKESGFAKSYLRSLVSDITVGPDELTMRGNKDLLAAAIYQTKLTPEGVRSSMPVRHAILFNRFKYLAGR
jgi:site-specific DNA recombinase